MKTFAVIQHVISKNLIAAAKKSSCKRDSVNSVPVQQRLQSSHCIRIAGRKETIQTKREVIAENVFDPNNFAKKFWSQATREIVFPKRSYRVDFPALSDSGCPSKTDQQF